MRKVLVVGAFDRFNFGDLLFPIVVEWMYRTYHQHPDVELEFFSMIGGDLRACGGISSGSFRAFEAARGHAETVAIVVSGGEVLGAQWEQLTAYLIPWWSEFRRRHNRLYNAIPSGFRNAGARMLMGGKDEYPFVVDSRQERPAVVYNAVGGLRSKPGVEMERFLKRALKSARLVAVRDAALQSSIEQAGIPSDLVPDSAVLMSEVVPPSLVTDGATTQASQLANRGYIAFQVNRWMGEEYLNSIAAQLNQLQRETGLKLVLCPIGTALGHEDHVALSLLGQKLEGDWIQLEEASVASVLCVLARARLYIGSSLHGAIMSMSYQVPYVGLGAVDKLDSYLRTWGVEGMRGCASTNTFLPRALQALSTSEEALRSNRDWQVELAKNHAEKLVRASLEGAIS